MNHCVLENQLPKVLNENGFECHIAAVIYTRHCRLFSHRVDGGCLEAGGNTHLCQGFVTTVSDDIY